MKQLFNDWKKNSKYQRNWRKVCRKVCEFTGNNRDYLEFVFESHSVWERWCPLNRSNCKLSSSTQLFIYCDFPPKSWLEDVNLQVDLFWGRPLTTCCSKFYYRNSIRIFSQRGVITHLRGNYPSVRIYLQL